MPRRHRSHSMELKRQVVAEYDAGETLHGLSKRHDVCRNLIRIRIAKAEAREFDDEVAAAEVLVRYEARIASLERLVGQRALELSFVKKGVFCGPSPTSEPTTVIAGSAASPSKRGCELMSFARSSYYAAPAVADADAALVTEIRAITDAWECYGYRRVGAELRHRGWIANARKVRRLMRLYDLNPRR